MIPFIYFGAQGMLQEFFFLLGEELLITISAYNSLGAADYLSFQYNALSMVLAFF